MDDTDQLSLTELSSKLDRETYLKFLEDDYAMRMQKEFGEESGLFGRIAAPKFDSEGITDKSMNDRLEDFLSNRIENIIEDDSIMKGIDDNIKQLTEAEENTKNAKKNLNKIK